jgi:hypothetical protein
MLHTGHSRTVTVKDRLEIDSHFYKQSLNIQSPQTDYRLDNQCERKETERQSLFKTGK